MLSLIILMWVVDGHVQIDSREYRHPCSIMEWEMAAWVEYGRELGAFSHAEFICFDISILDEERIKRKEME